jgi:hypothetical protein
MDPFAVFTAEELLTMRVQSAEGRILKAIRNSSFQLHKHKIGTEYRWKSARDWYAMTCTISSTRSDSSEEIGKCTRTKGPIRDFAVIKVTPFASVYLYTITFAPFH